MAQQQTDSQKIVVPVPDPTELTTAQVFREIAALTAVFNAQFAGIERSISQLTIHFDGLIHRVEDLHVEKFNSIQTQFRERDTRTEQTTRDSRVAIDAALQAAKEAAAAIDEKTAHLQALHDEKFRSIAVQFAERDVRTEQTSRDSKVAVDAALQAAKEAVGEQNRSSALAIAKSESATVKQIDQQQILLQTSVTALDSKITDIKDRLSLIEGKGLGITTANDAAQTNYALIISMIVAAVALAGFLIMLIRN